MYGLCRTDTFVGDAMGVVLTLRMPREHLLYGFFAWYLPDFLWMFSLTCALFGIMLPRNSSIVIWSAVSFLWGVLWETAQWNGVVDGTGDLWDVLMYIMAVIAAALINNLKRGK